MGHVFDTNSIGLQLTHDLSELSDAELHRQCIVGRQLMGVSTTLLVLALAEISRRRSYQEHGCSSAVHYAITVLKLEERQARELCRVGRSLPELPHLTEGFMHGDISYSALREVVRVAVLETDKAWLEAARTNTAQEIQRMVARTRPGHEPAPADSTQGPVHRRMSIDFLAEEYMFVREVLNQVRRELGGVDDKTALLACLSKVATGGEIGEPVLANHTLVVHHEVTTNEAWFETSDGRMPAPPTLVERLQCDSTIVDMTQVGHAGGGVPPSTRTIPAATRRYVMLRDGFRCSVPGCRNWLYLEVHHLEHFAQGGSHDPENLTLLCTTHHDMHHAGLLTIRGTPRTGLEFLDVMGRLIGKSSPRSLQTEVQEAVQDAFRLWGGRTIRAGEMAAVM